MQDIFFKEKKPPFITVQDERGLRVLFYGTERDPLRQSGIWIFVPVGLLIPFVGLPPRCTERVAVSGELLHAGDRKAAFDERIDKILHAPIVVAGVAVKLFDPKCICFVIERSDERMRFKKDIAAAVLQDAAELPMHRRQIKNPCMFCSVWA